MYGRYLFSAVWVLLHLWIKRKERKIHTNTSSPSSSSSQPLRDTINIVSESEAGLLKLSPFYNWSDKKLDRYIKENKLENEFDYFDPTKGSEKRECGLHGK